MGARTNCVNKEDNDKGRKGNYLKVDLAPIRNINEFAELNRISIIFYFLLAG